MDSGLFKVKNSDKYPEAKTTLEKSAIWGLFYEFA